MVKNERDVCSTNSRKRPWTGLSLILVTTVVSFLLLIYFGAWLATDRIDDRFADNYTATSNMNFKGNWWERSIITVCPLH